MVSNQAPNYPYSQPIGFNSPQIPPCPPSPAVCGPRVWESFRRRVTLVESPPVGASFIAITLFLLVAFISNTFTRYTSLARLGISISLTVIGLMALIILILFLL